MQQKLDDVYPHHPVLGGVSLWRQMFAFSLMKCVTTNSLCFISMLISSLLCLEFCFVIVDERFDTRDHRLCQTEKHFHLSDPMYRGCANQVEQLHSFRKHVEHLPASLSGKWLLNWRPFQIVFVFLIRFDWVIVERICKVSVNERNTACPSEYCQIHFFVRELNSRLLSLSKRGDSESSDSPSAAGALRGRILKLREIHFAKANGGLAVLTWTSCIHFLVSPNEGKPFVTFLLDSLQVAKRI